MPFRLGPLELGIVAFIVVLLFGAGRLPELGRGVGKAMHEFRKNVAGADSKEPGNRPDEKAPGAR